MMIWAVALLGLVLTVFGATAAAALVTASRAQLAASAINPCSAAWRIMALKWFPGCMTPPCSGNNSL